MDVPVPEFRSVPLRSVIIWNNASEIVFVYVSGRTKDSWHDDIFIATTPLPRRLA